MGPGRQIAKLQCSDRDTFEHPHLVTDLGQHSADLTVASLVKNQLQPTTVFGFFEKLTSRCPGYTFGQVDALFQLAKLPGRGNANHLDVVLLFNSVSRVS